MKLSTPRIMILSLGVISWLISVFPLLVSSANPFFDLDPEVMYIGNALSYVHHHQIYYTDHPGTPYIVTLAYSYLPLRLYAKFIRHEPFIDWAVQNYRFLFTYTRVVASGVFFASWIVFLSAVYKITKSRLAIIFAWLLLFSYTEVFSFGVRVAPETMSFLFISIWLYLFSTISKSSSSFQSLFTMAFVAGASFGLKFTNLALIPITLILGYTSLFKKKTRYTRVLLVNIGLCLVGFVSSTWVIRHRYRYLFNWIYALFTHTDFYGLGKQGIFDYDITLSSLNMIYHSQQIITTALLVTPLLFVLFYRSINTRARIPTLIMILISCAGFLIFAKYPKVHYQWLYFILTAYSVSLLLAKQKTVLILISLVLVSKFYYQSQVYFSLRDQINRNEVLQSFISNNPPKILTLWEQGPAKDFAILWTNIWSGNFMSSTVKKYYPKVSFPDNLQNIKSLGYCWDQLYLLNTSVPYIMENNKDLGDLSFYQIPNTGVTLITNEACLED